ncbi:hypothetical protein FOZ76_14660 [Verticiella sediminum]|uniref:Tyrosine-type recombinase/integrase n=1 Tax=Verticiella sediminum TaxID=1247510 RepID=A0A556AIC8_9BURK|nr:hypothetical protein [Verticiella sediminum]TSH92658.1 hypothetical protein FOZ76_14660 [Verticiella sediminum]
MAATKTNRARTAASRASRTKTPSPAWEPTGVDRLFKRVGKRKVSFIYKHLRTSETLASANLGDRSAIAEARRVATIKAAAILEGTPVAGSVADMLDLFMSDVAPNHYRDQSKNGKADRAAQSRRLTEFFGAMAPGALKPQHGYLYVDARAKVGARLRAIKEMALMATVCHWLVRKGAIDSNPFVNMRYSVETPEGAGRPTRPATRRQVVRFYLWAVRQDAQNVRTLGCAAMFTYLTGFRPSEVRPFLRAGITDEGVCVVAAKRRKGHAEMTKIREWSMKLRCVVARALDREDVQRSPALFAPSKRSLVYTRSGWGSSWHDAMHAWISSFDESVTAAQLVEHPAYFNLQDIRPTAITKKLADRAPDAYDFAAHANPQTTHRHYDRRVVKKASATE